MKNPLFWIALLPYLGLLTCQDDSLPIPEPSATTISQLQFIGEQIIEAETSYQGEEVGGLSGIDYANGTYYLISDNRTPPIRFYQMELSFDQTSFTSVSILQQTELLEAGNTPFADGVVDPESIRFDPSTGNIVWSSEGRSSGIEINPFVREAKTNGDFVKEYAVPELFEADASGEQGFRNNGVFEGLSLSANGEGFWVGMELPLVQDGPEPEFGTDTDSPIRITYIDRNTGTYGRQFAYELDPVVRNGGITVNGVVEILEYADDLFLVMERSFASGTSNGGNDIRIYKVDAEEATDISSLSALAGANYTKASKTLLLDLNDIRAQLSTIPGGTEPVVDNLEGMTFGPLLANGNQSLVVVSDNNFNNFGAQLNQFIVFEVMP